jgi:hypothetical protein
MALLFSTFRPTSYLIYNKKSDLFSPNDLLFVCPSFKRPLNGRMRERGRERNSRRSRNKKEGRASLQQSPSTRGAPREEEGRKKEGGKGRLSPTSPDVQGKTSGGKNLNMQMGPCAGVAAGDSGVGVGVVGGVSEALVKLDQGCSTNMNKSCFLNLHNNDEGNTYLKWALETFLCLLIFIVLGW